MSLKAHFSQLHRPRRALVGIILGLITLLASPQLAGPQLIAPADARPGSTQRAEATVTLWVPREAEGTPSAREREKSAQLTKLAAERLRARLKAARLKDADISVRDERTIVARARGNVSRQTLAGIVVPQGDFALRPLLAVGERWMSQIDQLPEGVKLRQGKESLEAKDAYLWSDNLNTLRRALKALGPQIGAPDELELSVYPSGDGWRALALGPPAATHKDIARATISQGQTGEDFVRMEFNRDLSARTKTLALSGDAQRWAMVLDGEVVSLLPRTGDALGKSLSAAAPEELTAPARRRAWAQQVAGRLAAFIPIQLIEADDSAK